MSTATFVYLKENIKLFYQKNARVIVPIVKFVFALFALLMFRAMFPYNDGINRIWIFILFSAVQAFVPIVMLFFGVAVLVLFNVWTVSPELGIGFLVFFLICLLLFLRIDTKYAVIIVLTPLLFFLKLEYFLPVLLGMTAGLGGVLPMAAGVLVYFSGTWILEANYMLPMAEETEVGYGLSRLIDQLAADQRLWIILVTFCLVAILVACLMRLCYENAWIVAIFTGNAATAFLLLADRLIFETDYGIARVLAELVLAILAAMVVQFFRGIGDISRMERVTFEDDDYIYYVKAVPKIKAAKMERNVTDIVPESTTGKEEESPAASERREKVKRMSKSSTDKKKRQDVHHMHGRQNR